MKITVGQLRSLIREAVEEMEPQGDSYGLEDYGVDLGDQHLRAGVDPDVRVDTCITCGENKLGAQAYTVGAGGQTTPSWFECGECNPEGLARASKGQKDDWLAGSDPGVPFSRKTEGTRKKRTLREGIPGADHDMGGWNPRAEYDENRWRELQRMLPDKDLSAALEMIKAEVPKIGKPGGDTVDGITKKVLQRLGQQPGGKEALAVRDVVNHLSKQRPTGGYSHVPGGDAFPRGRGGPGDTWGT